MKQKIGNANEYLFVENAQLLEVLRESRLFSHWPESLIQKLLPLSELLDFEAGVEILMEGQQNDRIFFLARGEVEVIAGQQHILNLKRRGDIFGEMSVISKKPCTASIVTKEKTRVFSINSRNIGSYKDLETNELNNTLYRLFAMILTDKLSTTTHKAREYERAKQELLEEVTIRKKSEKALRESEVNLRNILENSTNLFYSHTPEHVLTYLSPQIEDMLGYTADEAMIKWTELVSDHSINEIAFEHTEEAIRTGKRQPLHELELIRKDGKKIRTEIRESPLVEDGKTVAIIGSVTDITERHRIERIRRKEKDRLANVIEGTKAGTWEWNIQTGESEINERWADIIGYSLDDLKPISIDTWINNTHPDDLKRSDELLQKHFSGELGSYECETRMRHKEGHWIWVLDKGKVVDWTEGGKPLRMFGSHQDITARKNAEEELLRSENNFKSFFDTIDNYLFILDEEGLIEEVNQAVVKQLGYSKSELIGKSVLTVHPENRLEEAGQIVMEMLEGKRKFCPVPLITVKGDLIHVETYINKGTWNGKPAVFWVSKDISIIKESEEKFIKIFHRSPAIAGLSDLETGEYIEVNQTFYDKLGFTPSEIIGKPASDVIQMDFEIREQVITELQEKGHIENMEAVILTKSGQPISVMLFAETIELQGKLFNFTSAVDITERKQAEEQINTLLQEKEILLKEVHHRIRNNMSMIKGLLSLQSGTLNNPEAKTALNEAQNRVESMLVLYDKLFLSPDFQNVSTRQYFETLINEIIKNFPNRDIVSVVYEIEDVMLNAKTIFNLGIIINELITNTMKHAFVGKEQGKISASLSVNKGHATIMIQDDGKELPASVSFENPESGFGFKLVSMLVKQLDGNIQIGRENGTKFTIEFNIET